MRTNRRTLLIAGLTVLGLRAAQAGPTPANLVGVFGGSYDETHPATGEGFVDLEITKSKQKTDPNVYKVSGEISIDGGKTTKLKGTYSLQTGELALAGSRGRRQNKVHTAVEAQASDSYSILTGSFETRARNAGGDLLTAGDFLVSKPL